MIEASLINLQEGFTVFLLPFILTLAALSCCFLIWQQQQLKTTEAARFTLSENTLWLFVLSPWCAGLLALVINHYNGPTQHFFAGIFHWHSNHLSSLLSWHSMSTLVFTGLFVKYTYRYAALLIRDYKKTSLLKQLSTKDGDIYRLDSDINLAFCAGVIKPRCFLSGNLDSQLSKDEYDIISRHEQAHVNRRDPLRKWLMSILTAFFPYPVAQLIQSNMSLVCEQAADNLVTKGHHDKIDIAATLVKFSKLTAAQKSSPLQNPITTDFSLAFDRNALRQRVLCLLDDKETKKSALPLVVITIIVSSSIVLVDSSHHLIDSFLLH